jgi:hypothetical protein
VSASTPCCVTAPVGWIRAALHMWRLPPGAAHAKDLTAGLPSGYDNVGAWGRVHRRRSGRIATTSEHVRAPMIAGAAAGTVESRSVRRRLRACGTLIRTP